MKKILLLLLIFAGSSLCYAGNNLTGGRSDSLKQDSKINETIKEIENGFENSDVSKISAYISSQVYLSFLNDASGYYSSNQAYYILEKFFKEYSVISFSFDRVNFNTTTPFATGIYYYEHKGTRSEAKVYLSLKLSYDSWEITQISID